MEVKWLANDLGGEGWTTINETCTYSSWKTAILNILFRCSKTQATNLLTIESFLIPREDRSTVK